jgi:caffeoyl-CoA O-methyltransferase
MLTLTHPDIEEYAASKTQPTNALLNDLLKETHEQMEYPQMLTGPLEGSFLRLMVQISGAKSVLEIGMFTGYSALSMAEGLPSDGKLVTLEINPKCIEMASKYFEKSEHGKKITVKEGPAIDSLKSIEGPFDLVFIDADKTNYKNYYDAVLPKLKSGGIILVDNVLWSGAVLDPKTDDDKAIVELNNYVVADSRVDKVLLTIRDGVFLIRKK